MSSKPQSANSANSKDRLPFEPAKNKKKAAKPSVATQTNVTKDNNKPRASAEATAIPEVVSRRMVGRMALFCGVPTALGISTFIASYFIVTQEWFPLPTPAVVLVSMGFFGLGVLGLSYGVLSASWDEELPGSKLGWQEFTTNFGRMRMAWQASKRKE